MTAAALANAQIRLIDMPLSREQRDATRKEHWQILEDKEVERQRQVDAAASPPVTHEEELAEQERERQKIRSEVEAEFYSGRGYKRYVDHLGIARWLTPDEYDARMRRRHGHRKRSRNEVTISPRVQQILIYVGVALLALAIGFVLER